MATPTRMMELAERIGEGDGEPVLDGSLFRQIRGIESKLQLVANAKALASLSKFIGCKELSNPSIKAIAQAAANTDGQAAATRSESVCHTISSVPGLLAAVVSRMKEDVDAVRLVNNLVANSDRGANLFVQVDGSMETLKECCSKFKLHAFGVINHLSRSETAAAALLAAGFVEDVLLPTLSAASKAAISVEQEATMARGTLALANLTGPNRECSMLDNEVVLGTIVKVLDHAARGVRLATITWLPPAVLFGLRNMTGNAKICIALMHTGLPTILARLLNTWCDESGAQTLSLSLEVIANISAHDTATQPLWDAGIMEGLRVVSEGGRGEPVGVVAAAGALVEDLFRRHRAVCMGMHRRLGAKSPLLQIDDSVLYSILQEAFGPFRGNGTALDEPETKHT